MGRVFRIVSNSYLVYRAIPKLSPAVLMDETAIYIASFQMHTKNAPHAKSADSNDE